VRRALAAEKDTTPDAVNVPEKKSDSEQLGE